MLKKRMFSLRTKAEVILIVALFVGIAVSSVWGTVTLTESGGTLFVDGSIDVTGSFIGTAGSSAPPLTRIRNSNNNSWAVTEGNLASAIADVSEYGTVWIGDDFTITSAISLDDNSGVVLDFENHNVTVNGNIEFVNVTSCLNAVVRNAQVKINSPTEVTGGVIKVFSDSWANRVDFLTVENIYIDNRGGRNLNVLGSLDAYDKHNYTGIELEAIGAGSGRIDSCVFRDITMEGAGTGISIDATGSNYCNGNLFDNVYLDEFEDGIEFLSDENNNNVFRHFKMQCNPITIYGLKNITGSNNVFDNLLVWDVNVVTVCPDIIYEIWVGNDSFNTKINAHSISTTSYQPDFILDEGISSDISATDFGSFYYDADYDYKLSVNAGNGYYYVRLGEYGYMPSSGNYDRNTDFQALMSLICDNDDIVIKLNNGTYEPDQYIAVDGKNITIEGRADHTTILKVPAGDSMVSGMFSADGDGDSNLTFRNIVFDGSEAADSSVGIYFGINADSHGLTVENCRFIGWNVGTSRAIYVYPHSDDIVTNIKIVECEFFNCDYAVVLAGDADPSIVQYADVSHNYFKECQFSIFCDYVRNSSISNNRIISTIASSDGITLTDSIDIIVDGNNVNVVDDGIIETGGADYNMIVGNNCRHSGDPMTIVGGNTNSTINII